MKRYVRVARSGYAPGVPKGDVSQRPATFVVGTDGKIALAHYNRDASDNRRPTRSSRRCRKRRARERTGA